MNDKPSSVVSIFYDRGALAVYIALIAIVFIGLAMNRYARLNEITEDGYRTILLPAPFETKAPEGASGCLNEFGIKHRITKEGAVQIPKNLYERAKKWCG